MLHCNELQQDVRVQRRFAPKRVAMRGRQDEFLPHPEW